MKKSFIVTLDCRDSEISDKDLMPYIKERIKDFKTTIRRIRTGDLPHHLLTTIPKPVADYGDPVLVCNYRKSDIWERGVIAALRYGNTFGSYSWHYDVRLDRKSKKGGTIVIYVGDNAIEKISEENI